MRTIKPFKGMGSTHFAPPKTSDNLLIRKDFLPIEEGLLAHRLTLCVSPAGYGKTTLLAQWYRSIKAANQAAVWVSLTPADADALSLIAVLEAGIRQLLGTGDLFEDTPTSAASPDLAGTRYGRQLQRLQVLLGALDAPLILFLDNFHEVDTPEISALFNNLLHHSDAHCHFVISSRSEPSFRYTALVLEGRCRSLDSHDLKLSPSESAQFIQSHIGDGYLSKEEADLIYEKTEGWPIAIQLCCLLVNKHKSALFLRDFSGRDIDLGHFLNEQVFLLLNPKLQHFAARAALFENFCAELCDAALQRSDSAQLISDLMRQKLFIYSLDRNAGWVRYHQMFREFLLGTEVRPSAEETTHILTNAAHWSHEQSRYIDTIDYAIRAKNYSFARDILVASVQTIVRDEGLLPNLLQWSQKIPVEDSVESFDLHYWTSWSLAFSCRYLEAEKEIRLLEKSLLNSSNLSREQLTRYRSNIGSLKVAIKIFQDKSLTTYHASAQWLAKYRKAADPFHVGVAAGGRFISARLQLEVVEAKRALDLAKTVIAKANSPYGTLWIITLDSLGQMEFGDYRVAEKALQLGYQRTKSASGQVSVIHSTMALLLAKVAYEQGDSQQALVYLREGYLHIMDHGLIETAAAGLEVRCYIEAHRDFSAAISELKRAEFLIGHYPQRLHFIFGQLRFNLLINAGKIEQAVQEAELLDITSDGMSLQSDEENNPLVLQQKQVMVVKLKLLKKRWDEAHAILQQLLAVASTAQRPRFHVELLTLDAYAQIQQNRNQTACRVAMKAAVIAAQNGLYRVFFENRYFFEPLASELAARRNAISGGPEDKLLERLLNEYGVRKPINSDEPKGPTEPLTRRELELLRLLDSGLSVQAIADHLFLSKATVKWHLYNLYRKLGVSSRPSALEWAKKHLTVAPT